MITVYSSVIVGPSGTNRPPASPSPATRRVIYSSDEEDEAPARPTWPPPRPSPLPLRVLDSSDEEDEVPDRLTRPPTRKRTNPFVDDEAGVDGEESTDEEDGDDVNLEDFIVPDNVFD